MADERLRLRRFGLKLISRHMNGACRGVEPRVDMYVRHVCETCM